MRPKYSFLEYIQNKSFFLKLSFQHNKNNSNNKNKNRQKKYIVTTENKYKMQACLK